MEGIYKLKKAAQAGTDALIKETNRQNWNENTSPAGQGDEGLLGGCGQYEPGQAANLGIELGQCIV